MISREATDADNALRLPVWTQRNLEPGFLVALCDFSLDHKRLALERTAIERPPVRKLILGQPVVQAIALTRGPVKQL
ncbi:MAG: hypothetical protein H7Z42_18375 [Roseiflexaceae bacterium]|nr:hypothetical protein [Roseiflexaceae bacterium]